MSLALKLALSPLLLTQAVLTRARMPRLPEAAGERCGTVGEGPPLRLLVAGDSSAAGVGVGHQRDALAPQLACLLAAAGAVAVDWQLRARSGLTTSGMLALVRDLEPGAVDLAVVVSGVNDVVDQVSTRRAVAAREALADQLCRVAGARHLAFASLPPVHAFPGLPQPLRWVAGNDARRHNRALSAWAATRDDVSYVDLQLPLDRAGMASDGFHPGAPVYRLCAERIAHHLAAHLRPSKETRR